MVMNVLRAIGRAFLPVNVPLPRYYWNWLWLAAAVKLLVALPLFLALIVPYLLALAVVTVIDKAGCRFEGLYVACYARDLAASGWRQRLPQDTPPEGHRIIHA